MKRVVVTGAGMVTSLGYDWEIFSAHLRAHSSGVRRMSDWDCFEDLNTRLAAPVTDFVVPAHFSRKKIRTMGRVALMATRATEMALADAGLLDDPILGSGETGVAYGSSAGNAEATTEFNNLLLNHSLNGITATTYIRMMSHTTPVNIGVYFGLQGRLYATSTACTASSQGIGSAYEAIRFGQQTVMIAGGADELSVAQAAVFDTLFATSVKNDTPQLTPRPFDRDRDGLVIGEGAGTLILEELEHALRRGAPIYAEVVGYGTNSDGGHVTQPIAETMMRAMELSLADAGLDKSCIGYINAHGTATDRGDVAETTATERLFGCNVPVSTLKGNLGHTLGACGAIEAWASIRMMNEGWFAPTLNLENIDENCGNLAYITGAGQSLECEYVMSNNFAFGGINTSLIFKRWDA